jgi:hypothetical protein
MTMVSKYPQNSPSPGTPIGISQFRVAVRAITNKKSTSMKILSERLPPPCCLNAVCDVKLDFRVHLHPQKLA